VAHRKRSTLADRLCRGCGRAFTPKRCDQVFCETPCRLSSFSRRLHRCRCGKPCRPRKPAQPRQDCAEAQAVALWLRNHRKHCPGCKKEK